MAELGNEFNFEFDFNEEDDSPRLSFRDKMEKLKLEEFKQQFIAKDTPDRHTWISVCAYYKAERRGFIPGLELDDWLEAEQEFLDQH